MNITQDNRKILKVYTAKCWVVIGIWFLFLLANLFFFIKTMVPEHRFRAVNNPYTTDSVWDPGITNYHNDMLLNTLFFGKTVYISPNSWYVLYVEAFAENVVLDATMEVYIDAVDTDLDRYSRLNYMGVLAHETLFDAQINDLITNDTPESAACLFIDIESVAICEGIDIYHDKLGNLYLRGHENEE